MSFVDHEKEEVARREKEQDVPERAQTTYNDNFQGLTLKTTLVYVVCTATFRYLPDQYAHVSIRQFA